MPNYDMYNTDPYMRFLNWRNSNHPVNSNAPLVNPQSSITGDYLGSNYLNPLKGRQLGITPDITRQGNWQTGSNILTPQNAGGQGMSQVGEGKYVSNSLAKYYNNGTKGTQQVSPLNAGANNNLPMTQNSEMMGPQRPGFFQNQWNKAKNSYSDSPFNKAIHPDSPWAGRAQPATAGISGTGGTVSPATGGMGGAMGYLGAANAIMGMLNRNQGSSQPVVSQPVVVNNPPPIGGSSSRGERRNRLSSLPNYASGFGNVPNKNALLYKPRYAGYETRDITPSEDTFFQKNPHTAGMATEDKRIIINPHSGLSPRQNEAVRMLEASRLYMNDNNINPDFELTPNQVDFFNDPSMKVVGGVQYKDNPNAAKQSIISRIIVGDPSAQDVTPEQQAYADMISEKMGIKPRMGTKPQYAANFIGSPDVDEFGNPIRSGNALVRIMNRETPSNQSVFNTPTQTAPTSMESPTTASIEKPGFFARIGNALNPKEQPIPADYNTPEGANYFNRLMAESQRKPTFTEKLPQALALMSGAFDPYGRFANANANIINMTQQQEQARRQAPVNYLNQVMAMGQAANLPLQQRILQGQVENIPLQQEHLKAQTKALQQPKSITATDMAMLAAGGDPIAIKALGFSKTGENVTPYSVFYQGQKQKYPEKTDYDISQEWSNYQKDIQGQYKPSEYLTFYQGQKQDNPNITDTEIADKWVTYTQNKGLNTYQTVQTAGALRNEIKSNPYVKEFQDVNTKFSVMEKALAESKVTGDRIATDQALITLFNKMTDPESVVRESEYARTPDDASLMNKLKGKIEKLQKGGAGLTDEDRQALYTMANKFYDVYSKNYDETVKNYKELAKASGIKENLIGIPYERKAEINTKQSSKMTYNPTTGEIE